MTLATIDWDSLGTAIWASAVGGVGVTTAYGLTIVGATRAVELRRAGRAGRATLYGVVGAFGGAVVVAAIVFGIVILSR
jgi:hypothetical protein